MEITVDIKLTREQITEYLSDVLYYDSQYDELYKREELITILCLEGSCADEQDLKELFKRILEKYHERNNNKESK